MKVSALAFLAVSLVSGTAIPVHAQDLLGGLLGGGDSGSLITLDDGAASGSGLVNIGLGGGDGNLVDLNLGGGSAPIVDAGVSLGGSGGGLGVNAAVLNDVVTANVNAGGNNGLLGVDAGLLGGAIGANVGLGGGNLLDVNVNIGLGGPGAPGVPGAPGRNAANGANGASNNGTNGNNGINGVGSRSNNLASACDGMPANQVTRLMNSTRFDSSWMRASGVKVQPIGVCGDVKAWLNAQLGGSNLGAALRHAVQSDPLISASLGRTNYGAEDVLAVKQSGSQLIVYVY